MGPESQIDESIAADRKLRRDQHLVGLPERPSPRIARRMPLSGDLERRLERRIRPGERPASGVEIHIPQHEIRLGQIEGIDPLSKIRK